ncbi:MAG TPA: transposase, partial [Candidatus Acetothermia bacterium]|nr:transposase [Candidatus Acetothermia bacterium]
ARDKVLKEQVLEVVCEHPAYGYRKIQREIKARGVRVNHKRLSRWEEDAEHGDLLLLGHREHPARRAGARAAPARCPVDRSRAPPEPRSHPRPGRGRGARVPAPRDDGPHHDPVVSEEGRPRRRAVPVRRGDLRRLRKLGSALDPQAPPETGEEPPFFVPGPHAEQ